MEKLFASIVMDMRYPACSTPTRLIVINFTTTLPTKKISLLRMSTIGISNKMGLLQKIKLFHIPIATWYIELQLCSHHTHLHSLVAFVSLATSPREI